MCVERVVVVVCVSLCLVLWQKEAEAGGSMPEGGPAKPAVAKADSIEETLICQICQVP